MCFKGEVERLWHEHAKGEGVEGLRHNHTTEGMCGLYCISPLKEESTHEGNATLSLLWAKQSAAMLGAK